MAYRHKKSRPIADDIVLPVIEEPQPETQVNEPPTVQIIEESIEVEPIPPEEQVVDLIYPEQPPKPDYSFFIQVTEGSVRKRRGPGTEYEIIGYITDDNIYRIVETRSNWGKLTDGSWINLDYVTRL